MVIVMIKSINSHEVLCVVNKVVYITVLFKVELLMVISPSFSSIFLIFH